ncbi:hypothetical protein G6F51_014637 [Rhizopus arrhizus]|uniref:Uncharacterized protein n=1 Tax=Rhizopus oryzae TaxID=64495 RepID=A0A9P7BYD6_RHIOR|nr:hypothetical protein G6F51_014637 [Rhizopus arrhizus]
MTEPVSSTPRPLASPMRFSVPVAVPTTVSHVSLPATASPPLSIVNVPVPTEPISIRSLAASVEISAVVLETVTVPTPPAWLPM